MANTQIDKCFVIMPFDVKPKNDGSNETYDFDKIYRVIIQRAIRQAKMEPIRADETKDSRSIHADMFKDLRDRPIVLADLSLYNPNAFNKKSHTTRHLYLQRNYIILSNMI